EIINNNQWLEKENILNIGCLERLGVIRRKNRILKDKLEVGAGMGSKNKKTGGKKKKSAGKFSKAPVESQPESVANAGTEIEETGTVKASSQIESSSLPSKKRKSGSDNGEEKLDPSDEASSAAADKAGKGKKLKSGSDGGRAEVSRSGALARQLRPRKQPKVFQDVTLVEGDANRVIGRRIKVFWPLDDNWYAGHVKGFRLKTKQHHVVYDDGEEEWLLLRKEKIKIQVELGEVFGESVGASAAMPSKAPLNVKEGRMNVEKGKKIDTSSIDDGKKNGVKEKESGGVVGDGKKTGAKRKQHSTVDNRKKQDGKRKKEDGVNERKDRKKEGNTEKSKLVEGENDYGGKKEDVGNALEIKVVEDQNTGRVDSVGDGSEKNEADKMKENKDNIENEVQVEVQAAGDGKNAKRPKNSKKTAPRTKRVGSGKQTQQKHVAEDQTEDADTKQAKVEQADAKQDIKRDEDSRFTKNANLKDVNVSEADSTCNDDVENQQKAKESDMFSRKKVDSSVTAGPETDTFDDVGSKHSIKDARKQAEQAEKCDEKNANAVVAEQLQEQPKVEVQRQANEDEPFKSSTVIQPNEKHSDARGGDEKASEDQVDVKDDDQLSKKHNKKYRVKVKT
ncbi:hypothetical protein KI387_013498, partial [Taxus chinensis]